ncbi:MAG: hypothetical protein RBR25_05775, partial [Trichloromonas sp.]|nr:hypothetical protein [Trichloromonas sp.]
GIEYPARHRVQKSPKTQRNPGNRNESLSKWRCWRFQRAIKAAAGISTTFCRGLSARQQPNWLAHASSRVSFFRDCINVGSVYYSNCPCFPIDTVYFVSSDQTSYFLYLALQGLNFISSDSAVPGLNRNYTYSLELTVPNAEIFTLFETRVQPIFEQINALTIWNGKLRQARDLLLPKLMSGALDVSRISIPQEVGA